MNAITRRPMIRRPMPSRVMPSVDWTDEVDQLAPSGPVYDSPEWNAHLERKARIEHSEATQA